MRKFEYMTDEQLRNTIVAIKGSYIRLRNMVIEDPSTVPLAQIGTTMQLPVIQELESEARSRGFDPTHEVFGEDVLGQAIKMLTEE